VTATGSNNGMPYMQINECINGHTRATIYIGVGPGGNQLQLWGYDLLNSGITVAQTIFQIDTPNVGTKVAQGLYYTGVGTFGTSPNGVPAALIGYYVMYSETNMNNEYGDVDYYFYPDHGIVQKVEYNTSLGDLYWNLARHHIVK
jgi:hypothetical protein